MRARWAASLVVLFGCPSPPEREPAPSTPSGTVATVETIDEDLVAFRECATSGCTPDPAGLDRSSFFAGRARDPVTVDCGEDLCLAGDVVVAPRLGGDPFVAAYVELGTPLPPPVDRPPAHLVLVLEGTSFMREVWPSVALAIDAMRAALGPDDVVTVVHFVRTAQTLARAVRAVDLDPAAIVAEAEAERPIAWAALHEALVLATHEARSLPGVDARIVLVTSGHTQTGVSEPERIVGLVEGLARSGTPVGVVATTEIWYGAEIPVAIAEVGTGGYAFVRTGGELVAALEREALTVAAPLATDVELRIVAGEGRRIGRVWGPSRARVDGASVVYETPALMMLSGRGAEDGAGGLRGPAGGIFVELLDSGEAKPGALAVSVEVSFSNAAAERRTSALDVDAPAWAPGDTAAMGDPARAATFAGLAGYLGLQQAITVFAEGDCALAQGVASELIARGSEWLADRADADGG